jgi:hypothetical protein
MPHTRHFMKQARNMLQKNDPPATDQGKGIFNDCPTRSRFGSVPGLAAINASTLTPYFLEMAENVSPSFTMYVRADEDAPGWRFAGAGFCPLEFPEAGWAGSETRLVADRT